MHRMTEKESAKRQEQEKLQVILNEILKEEDNKYCADCEAKGPRWASWNLGVFLCIRCAGIHRNLGVHVSKVKSVNLDTWTVEQVQSVRVVGNSVAKAMYEANLPPTFRRPQSDSSLEAFIRAKYEHKRYVDKTLAPPKVDPRDLMIEMENSMSRSKKLTPSDKTTLHAPKTSPNTKRKPRKPSGGDSGKKSNASNVDIVEPSSSDDPFGLCLNDNGPTSTGHVGGEPAKNGTTLDDLFGMIDTHQHPIRNYSSPFLPAMGGNSNGNAAAPAQPPPSLSPTTDNNSFGEFSSAPVAAAPVVVDDSSTNEQLLFSASGTEKKSKNDILALYGSASNVSIGAPAPQPQPFTGTAAINPMGTSVGYYPAFGSPAPVAMPTNYAYPTATGMPAAQMYPGQSPMNPYGPTPTPFAYSNVPQAQMVGAPLPSGQLFGVGPLFGAVGQQTFGGVGQTAQLQAVQNQLAALQMQRAQQPQSQQINNPVANTLATNLWQ